MLKIICSKATKIENVAETANEQAVYANSGRYGIKANWLSRKSDKKLTDSELQMVNQGNGKQGKLQKTKNWA